jgi:PAS domain S-box-containing protein
MDSIQPKQTKHISSTRVAIKGAGIYLLLGAVWIFLSDALLEYLLRDPTRLTFYQSLKGWAYVVVTALLAYVLLFHLARERVRQQETAERLQRVIQAGNVGLWEWDLQTDQVQYSVQWKRQIGYADHEIGDDFEEWRKRVHPDDLPGVMQNIKTFLDNPWPDFQLRFRFRHRDGSYRWILAQASVIRDQQGNPAYMLGSHVDMTDLLRAEAEVRKLNAELERRVAERTRELEASNRELETFTYTVSHDLKAPLRGIDGYSRLLQEQHPSALDAEGRLFVANIRRGVSQMNDLIEDLLAYSRMERTGLENRLVDVAALVSEVVAERHDEIEALHAEVRIELPSLSLQTDREGLILILRNLLDNALKFRKPGLAPVIEITAESIEGHVRLRVRDNGIGFDMRYHARIFDIFQRLPVSGDYPGTGIGLAIVRKVVDRMHGRIWAESVIGEGTTFYLEW